MPTIILTHRGLEPNKQDFYPESSYEAFEDQISRGFGIEFDPNFCKNGIVVSHDATLKRITEGKDERNFSDVSVEELKSIKYGKTKQGRIPELNEILDLIKNSKAQIHAMHLKGKYQTHKNIDLLIEHLKKYSNYNSSILTKLIIFDIKPEIARYIKYKMPELQLAPSIAHHYDIKRYNSVVSETLFSMKDAIKYKQEGLYGWVWLDEWDLADEDGAEKKLYTEATFNLLKQHNYKIALVTPELHGTSPGLYGGESHRDAKDLQTLFNRIKEILSLQPDAICTDWPEEAKLL